MDGMELEVVVHHDSDTGGYWAQVVQLPGCFAAGHSREELENSLEEAVALYLHGEEIEEIATTDHIESVERYRLSDDRKLIPA